MVEVLPRTTGVYFMRDAHGHIIYVGKALDIRSRVRAYLGGDVRPSVSHIRERTAQVDFVLTSNEKEALLLENQLIKSHRPRYNIVLKDDKSYVSIKVTTNHDWPGIYVTRRIVKDGARYFGPYSSARAMRNTLSAIGRIFPVRRCKDTEFANRVRPCMFHQVGICSAPCVKKVGRAEYAQLVNDLVMFLEGRDKTLEKVLEERMRSLSLSLEFERAARIRDQVAAIRTTLVPQAIVQYGGTDMDVFGAYRHTRQVEVTVLRISKGTIMDSASFSLATQDENDFITPCMLQFYLGRKDIPPLIYTDTPPEDTANLEAILSDLRGGKVSIRGAVRGRPKQWIQMAQDTALNNFRGETSVLDEIARAFKMPSIPYRMECYDISTLLGEQAVGSRVVFIGGMEEKSLYRHYRIEGPPAQNDFAMLATVMARRFRQDSEPRPDLLVIDGGKGQLNICLKVLKDLGVTSVPVVAMAKERGSAKDRFFLPGRKDAVMLPRGSDALKILQRLRDEAHRFAITYHRKLRSQAQHSLFEDIPGIGPKKTALLLKHAPDLHALTGETLSSIKGLTRSDVKRIMEFMEDQMSKI
ncbi:MAG: excinuclease ABC subunit UvrC [Syntrophaceae bacterium]